MSVAHWIKMNSQKQLTLYVPDCKNVPLRRWKDSSNIGTITRVFFTIDKYSRTNLVLISLFICFIKKCFLYKMFVYNLKLNAGTPTSD